MFLKKCFDLYSRAGVRRPLFSRDNYRNCRLIAVMRMVGFVYQRKLTFFDEPIAEQHNFTQQYSYPGWKVVYGPLLCCSFAQTRSNKHMKSDNHPNATPIFKTSLEYLARNKRTRTTHGGRVKITQFACLGHTSKSHGEAFSRQFLSNLGPIFPGSKIPANNLRARNRCSTWSNRLFGAR